MADKGLITKSTLTDIGNAIRAKNGLTTTYKPSEMAAAIKAIKVSDNTEKDTCTWAAVDYSSCLAYYLNSTTLGDTETIHPRLGSLAKKISDLKIYTKSGTYPSNSDTSSAYNYTSTLLYLTINGKNFHEAPLGGNQLFKISVLTAKAAIKTYYGSLLVVHSSLVQRYAESEGWCYLGLGGIICYDKIYDGEPFDFKIKYPS